MVTVRVMVMVRVRVMVMKLSFNITLAEMDDILRKSLAEMYSCEVEDITVSSYGKVRIRIDESGMIDSTEFLQSSKDAPL